MNNSYQEVDFVVVGAGPIGSSLALRLAAISENTKVLLVDHAEKPNFSWLTSDEEHCSHSYDTNSFDTKVFAINKASQQLFDQLGLWEKIKAKRACAYKRMHVWDAEGTGSVDFTSSEFDVENLGFIIEAGIIQQVLDDEIENQSRIIVSRPMKISKLELACSSNNKSIENQHNQAAKSVVELENGEKYRTSLVCAADGARSSLRELAKISLQTENCEQKALVANIELSLPHENCAWQIFLPTGPLAFLPLSSKEQNYCSIVWSLDNSMAAEIDAMDDEQFLETLEKAIEGRFGSLKLASSRQSFPLYQIHAEQYGKPGFVLVGDAAHSIHPLAGLGANLGFQDVLSLGEEIQRAHDRGIEYGHSSLISRYQRKRRVDNEMTLQAMRFFKKTFGHNEVHFNALRNIGLKIFSRATIIKKLVVQHARISE